MKRLMGNIDNFRDIRYGLTAWFARGVDILVRSVLTGHAPTLEQEIQELEARIYVRGRFAVGELSSPTRRFIPYLSTKWWCP
jgi:hypothetical protein